MGNKLNHLAQQIKDIHEKNAFNQIDLNRLKQRLARLEQEFNHPMHASSEQKPTSFSDKFSLLTLSGENQSAFFSWMKSFVSTK